VADVVTEETRSRMMSGIRGKDTKPELVVRKALFAAGFRFRLHRRDLPGAPDVVMAGRRVAVFVHGCFWHRHKGCRLAAVPATRPEFWKAKLDGNAARDIKNIGSLRALGWRVLVVWECALRDRKTLDGLPGILGEWVRGDETEGELRGAPR
jgi:DNA mismatch endonuclease (patch repair protein)